MSDKYVIRPWTADDVPFTMDSWLKSWRVSKYAGVIRNNDYFTTTRTLIEDLIARGAKVLVADADTSLLGWICFEVKEGKTVLHYLFIKDPFLGLGIEDALLNAAEGEKPGFMTFYVPYVARTREWQWAPEIARRKSL